MSVHHQEQAYSENFVMGSDAAEFVNKVKDQVRNRYKRMSNVAESGDEHSIIWGMFMAATMNAATFMGKNFVDIQNFIMNSSDLTLKNKFDITLKLVSEQEEINNLDKIHSERNSWKQQSLIGDERVINLQRTSLCILGFCVVPRKFNISNSTKLGRTGLQESDPRNATEIIMLSMDSRLNSSGTFPQDSQRCSSVIKSMIF